MTRPLHQIKLNYLRPLRSSPWNWHAGSASLAIAAAILVIAGAVAPLVVHVGSPSDRMAWLVNVFFIFWLASPLAGAVCGIVAVYRERPGGLAGVILNLALYPLIGFVLGVWFQVSGFD